MDRAPRIRRILLVLLIVAIATAVSLLFGTNQGQEIRRDTQENRQAVREWVSAHPYTAPTAYVLLVVVVGLLALPVWWLQIVAGFAFGMGMGIVWSQVGVTLTATCTASLSRFLLAEWFRTRVEKRVSQIRALNEKLGHHGLLVVWAVRWAHFIPTGLSNYAFGLTPISLLDITVGTAIGGIPKAVLYVTAGAAPHLLTDWRYVTALVGLYLVLLVPLVVRYLRPDWFKRMGIE
jgi:uncharacterized membrane protein YdjX (TVP38/TMEM64 family)